MNKSFDEYKKWFDEFTKEHLDNEEGVSKYYMNLKIVHTSNVVSVIERVARSENLSDSDVELAKIIGLMHDVGRFPQIHKYKIDNDKLTENHALLGIKTIKELKILDDEDEDIKNIILTSILYHNMIDIPKTEMDDRIILFSKLIRDADKVDIYRVVIEDIFTMEKEKLQELYSNLSFAPITSDAVYSLMKKGITVPKSEVKTMLDHTLLQMAWVTSDINYVMSKKIIKENKYIEKIFNFLESDDRGREIFELIMKSLQEETL